MDTLWSMSIVGYGIDGPVKIVDCPINSMMDRSIVFVCLPEGTTKIWLQDGAPQLCLLVYKP